MFRSHFAMAAVVALTFVMVVSALAGATSNSIAASPSSVTTTHPSTGSLAPTTEPSSSSSTTVFGTNSALATTVTGDEKSLAASGYNPSSIHPPNLHQAPSLASTGGSITPLYNIAPAPMGSGYFGESNTSGKIRATTVNTTSLAGVYSTSDPLGTQTEEYAVTTGSGYNDIQPATDSYGAQLNSVITNVSIFGKTSFYNPSDPDAPQGCPGYAGNPTSGVAPCPNEFWMQNYIEYQPAIGLMQIGDEIWNFSNPTASWGTYGSTVDEQSMVGFGSIAYGLYFLTNTPSEYGPSITISYPFTLVLYENVTRGPCHLDTVPGTGVPSCKAHGSKVSMTEPVNEVFFNYSVWKTPSQPCPVQDICQGQHVCPAVEPYSGIVCGEYDDIFFNSVNPATPTVGVPVHGPHGQIGSAAIEANGSAYDPVGLTNDFEFDYGIGSDDGDTNSVVYQDGTVGVDYCPNAHTQLNGQCAQYSATPAATDFGGETGETSIGEVGYWAAQKAPSGAGLFLGKGAPVEHLGTGASLLLGLWNHSGVKYPKGGGGEPLSYANIAPANAWVGVAAGAGVTNQSEFQVAPTFGWFSYWAGSGGSRTPTTLGPDLYLPSGMYTIEVLLGGFDPYIGTIDLTSSGQAPVITLTPDPSTGAYTPLWAFGNSDLGNISTNGGSFGVGSLGNQYRVESGAPTVGAPFGVPGSVSWLFSNLNDYLFVVWIGEFINSTTVYAQSNPAPSFLMEYPSWQLPNLNFFDVPPTNTFQLYFYHVQNFTLAGTSGIDTWGSIYTTPVTSVIFNDGQRDLVADNSFDVQNRGLEFIDGGRAAPVGAFPGGVRNIIWGNTFTPEWQYSYSGQGFPGTALIVGESFDRIYNNAFDPEYAFNATVSSGASYTNWWNATCQSGYDPLYWGEYPGPSVCEPLSYVQSVNGFSLTGSIVDSTYQGGNFWAIYGNSTWGDVPNPFANIPFKARTTSLTGPAGIASDVPSFAGDYAPLLTYTVYRASFYEAGLPASLSSKAFHVEIVNQWGSVLWQNSTETNTTPGGCPHATVCLRFYLPNGTYTFGVLKAKISGTTYVPTPVNGTLTVAGAQLSPTHISFGPKMSPASNALRPPERAARSSSG